MAKGALAKDPKGTADPKQAKALEMYNKGIKMLKKYEPGHPRRKIAENLVNRFGPQTGNANWNKGLQTKPTGKTVKPSAEAKFKAMTPEKQREELTGEAGALALGNINFAQGFDPNKPFAGYEMGFGQARDKAYNDVMSQFNRSMEPEFQRQNAEFQQRMADQGLDPASGAYQAQYKALADAQNNARLNAQSQASQAAYDVQQQAFNQGQTSYNMPFNWQQVQQPLFMTPWEQAGNVNLANVQAEAERKRQELANAGAARTAGIGAGATMANTQAEIAARERQWQRENVANIPNQQPGQGGFWQGVQAGMPGGVAAGGMQRR
jgi:hypothetical protein